jgi:hypothetical protein
MNEREQTHEHIRRRRNYERATGKKQGVFALALLPPLFFSPFPAAAAAAAGGVIINYKYTPRAIIKNEETQRKA